MKGLQNLMLASFFALSAMAAGAQEYQAPQDVKDKVSELRQYVFDNGTLMNLTYNGVQFPTYRLETGDYIIDVNRGSTQIVQIKDNRSDYFVDFESDGDVDRFFGSNGPFSELDKAVLRTNAYDVNSDHDTEFALEDDIGGNITDSISGLMDPKFDVARHSDAFFDRYEFYLDPVTSPELALGDKVRIYDHANKKSESHLPSADRAQVINNHAQNAYQATLDNIMRTIVR